MGPFDYDRYLVDQLVRPIANLYRVTPLAAGDTPAGQSIAYVRQKKLAVKEHIRFCADEGETQELFHPNAYGQRAFGDCLAALYAARRGNYACTGAAGRAPDEMVLSPLG